MKDRILQILDLQAQGKLTKDQAAELLAVLADQAREKEQDAQGASGTTQGAPSANPGEDAGARVGRAPGPPSENRQGCAPGAGTSSAAAAIHDLVDTAIGVGATVGRVATVWGGEILNKVYRQEDGNSVTLSNVAPPAGEAYVFRGNNINVSKVANISLRHAELAGNTINASKVANVSIERGRLSQSDINGSSLHHVTIEGAPAEAGSTSAIDTGIRAATLSATKFIRARIASASRIDNCSFMAAAVTDLHMADGSAIDDSRVNDSSIARTRLEHATMKKSSILRSHIRSLIMRGVTLENVALAGLNASEWSITGGTWNNVKIRRDPAASGLGGRDSLIADTTFENCTLTDCEFSGCTFRGTTLLNLKLNGITVRNVDFTGKTIDSEEAFRKAAGL